MQNGCLRLERLELLHELSYLASCGDREHLPQRACGICPTMDHIWHVLRMTEQRLYRQIVHQRQRWYASIASAATARLA